MMKKKIGLLLLFLALVGGAARAIQQARVYRNQSLEKDSIIAANDTARLVQLDSTREAYELRIVQMEMERDQLDRRLRAESALRAQAHVHIDTLRIHDTVPGPVHEDTTETYGFSGSDGPFSFRGDARLMPNRSGVFNVSVWMREPVPVDIRVLCQRGEGIRSASVLLETQDPFHVIPSSVYQDPNVCNPVLPDVFRWLPRPTPKAIGWEVVKGVGWIALWKVGSWIF